MDQEQPDPIVVVDLRGKRQKADEDGKDRRREHKVRAFEAEREDLVSAE